MNEKIIITGASGHLGNNIVQLLSNTNYQIKLLMLPNEDISIFADNKFEIAYGDIRDRDFLSKNIEENSVVIHCAGIIDISSNNKDLMFDVNVNGTKNIVDECIKKHCKKFVYTSSVHVIEEFKQIGVLKEPIIFDESKLIGDYAKSKCLATKYVYEKCKQGLNGVIVYPSGIIGPNDYKVSNTGKLIIDIANEDIKARVNGSYNFVDVRDVAQGVLLAIKFGKIGEGYILSGTDITVDKIFESVKSHFKTKKFTPKIAMWFVKMFSGLAELYYKLRKQKPLFTKYSLYTLTSNHNFDNTKAKTLLGWSTTDIDQTIADTLKWFVDNKSELFKQKTLSNYTK